MRIFYGTIGVMADYIVWKEEFAVGVPALDAEHQAMIAMINRSFAAKQQGKGADASAPLISDLINYAMMHFSHEEELLAKHKYPDLGRQISEHRYFLRKVEDIQQDNTVNPETTFHRIFEFLKEWWVNHIIGEDKKYGPFLHNT